MKFREIQARNDEVEQKIVREKFERIFGLAGMTMLSKKYPQQLEFLGKKSCT